jgi:hypothetical protein
MSGKGKENFKHILNTINTGENESISNANRKTRSNFENSFKKELNEDISSIPRIIGSKSTGTKTSITLSEEGTLIIGPDFPNSTILEPHINYINELSKEEKKEVIEIFSALRKYSRGYDWIINTFLRKKIDTPEKFNGFIDYLKNDSTVDKEIKSKLIGYTRKEFKKLILDLIDAIDSIFNSIPELIIPDELHPLQRRLTVYRGQKDGTITSDSYLSTSMDFYSATGFLDIDNSRGTIKGGELFVFDIQPGVKVIPMKYISAFSGEDEILVERNCVLYRTGKLYTDKTSINFLITETKYESINIEYQRIEEQNKTANKKKRNPYTWILNLIPIHLYLVYPPGHIVVDKPCKGVAELAKLCESPFISHPD